MTFLRRRYSWIRHTIHVCSETEKIVRLGHCVSSLANVLESDSLERHAICWNQSPRNWHSRLGKFGANPQGWSIRRCHRDVAINISCEVPKESYFLKTRIIVEWWLTCASYASEPSVIPRTLRILHWSIPKIDKLDGVKRVIPRVPIKVRRSTFNPIRVQARGHRDVSPWPEV